MNITVIKKREGRVDRKTGKVLTEKLRVTAYARVSTGNEEQLNSYKSQKKYYKEKITTNKEWEYVEIYADEAISGTLDYKRNDFMRMIQDAINGKFDMIITKSISRFARNTVDTLKYVRKLKEYNVAILFEEENINTLEMSGELLLTILSSVAQQESETISSHVKLGLKMKKERGELIGFNNCYGYEYDSKKNEMIIKEDEAEIVRKMYETYLEGHGAEYIAKMLTNLGVKTPKGFNYWRGSTVRGILKNEKYKGDVIQGKTFTLDPISHKRLRNMGEEDKYYIKSHHIAIVSPEVFDEVQEIMKTRCGARATGRRIGNVGRKYTMSSRMKCGYCGDTLVRRSLYSNKHKTNPAWLCVKSAKYGKEHCPNCRMIREDVIEKSFMDTYQLLCENNGLAIEEFLNNIKNCIRDNTTKDKIEKLKKQEEDMENKISRLVDLMVEGTLDNQTFEQKKENYLSKLEKIKHQLEQLSLISEDEEDIERGISKMRKVLKEDNLTCFDKEIFDALVDYIIIGGYDENGQIDPYMIKFICKSKFNFSERKDITTEKILNNNDLRKTSINNYIPILDFISRQQFFMFEKDDRGKQTKKVINKVRVRLEMEK